jgi:hypothetical protein
MQETRRRVRTDIVVSPSRPIITTKVQHTVRALLRAA